MVAQSCTADWQGGCGPHPIILPEIGKRYICMQTQTVVSTDDRPGSAVLCIDLVAA